MRETSQDLIKVFLSSVNEIKYFINKLCICLVGKFDWTDCMSAIFQNDRNSNGSSGVLIIYC